MKAEVKAYKTLKWKNMVDKLHNSWLVMTW